MKKERREKREERREGEGERRREGEGEKKRGHWMAIGWLSNGHLIAVQQQFHQKYIAATPDIMIYHPEAPDDFAWEERCKLLFFTGAGPDDNVPQRSNLGLSSYHIIMSSYHQITISSYHQIIITV